MNDTRERILAVAQELFIKDGYDKVSLREVAEQVGVTKAALYYHFSSKEQLLKTLVQPLQAAVGQLVGMLGARADRQAWASNWVQLVDWMFQNRGLFKLIETNRATFQAMGEAWIEPDVHGSLHEHFNAIFTDPSASLEDRARIAASFGAVAGMLNFPGVDAFDDDDLGRYKGIVLDVLSDVLQVDARETTPSGA
jgi:AcrR family transcriptional regulator